MPMGKGTYGSQKGRPKKREKMMGGGMYDSKRKKMMMGGKVDYKSIQDMEKM
tara:strand:+ start:319 stop:474 length:156 start_codon:yes stop_codon:yes gene_type:complete